MNDNNYLGVLTGVRAIAAYLVFFCHYVSFETFSLYPQWIKMCMAEMHIGVTIFFVLSGFLITFRYYGENKINWKKFFVNRFARIYPVYFLITTLTFLCISKFDLWIYILNVTFLRGYFSDHVLSGIGQGWTLTVEETFYFLTPFIFFVVKRNKFTLIIFPILFLIIGFCLVFFCKMVDFDGLMNSNEFMLHASFFGRSFEFFIGILLALLFGINTKKKYSGSLFTYLGIVIILLHIATLAIIKNNYGNLQESHLGILLNNFSLPLFGISSFFWGILTERSFIAKVLANKLFELLGKSSYFFYLIHAGIFAGMISKISSNVFFIFFVVNLFSVLGYLIIEDPLRQIIKRFILNGKITY